MVNYVAAGDPNLPADAVGGTDVWQCSITSGNAGSGFYAPSGGTTNMWDIYSYGTSAGTALMTYTFQGGTLNAGQSVSLLYAHNYAIAAGTQVGIQLLDASGNVQTEFVFLGGGPNGWAYADTGTGLATANEKATGKQYDANDPFTVKFTLTSSKTYTATASATATNTSSGAWSGTYTNPIAAIRVVNLGAGDGSDQYSNNLVVTNVPEPTSLAMLAGGGLLGGFLLRRRRNG